MRGRLGRYLLWQARDYAVERGAATLIVAGLLVLFALQTVGPGAPDAFRSGVAATEALAGFLLAFAPLATLIAVNGIVANDRRFHYFRFLFSKPMSAARYYAQTFLVSWAGTVAAAGLFVVTYGLVIHPVRLEGPLLFVTLYFLVFGGLGFLLSAVTRFDWMLLGIIWMLSLLARGFFPPDDGKLARVIDIILPPSHHLTLLAGTMVRGDVGSHHVMLWTIGYGITTFVLGLVAIHYRPLAA